jgi:hypothetical protein
MFSPTNTFTKLALLTEEEVLVDRCVKRRVSSVQRRSPYIARNVGPYYQLWVYTIRDQNLSALGGLTSKILDWVLMGPEFRERQASVDDTEPRSAGAETHVLTGGISGRDHHSGQIKDVGRHTQHAKFFMLASPFIQHGVPGGNVKVGVLVQRPSSRHPDAISTVLDLLHGD